MHDKEFFLYVVVFTYTDEGSCEGSTLLIYFFQLMLDELKILWFEGIIMIDDASFLGQPKFGFNLVVLCTLHDLSCLGIVSECTTNVHGLPLL